MELEEFGQVQLAQGVQRLLDGKILVLLVGYGLEHDPGHSGDVVMLQRPEVGYFVGRHLSACHRAPFAGILARDQELITEEIIGVVHQRHVERGGV